MVLDYALLVALAALLVAIGLAVYVTYTDSMMWSQLEKQLDRIEAWVAEIAKGPLVDNSPESNLNIAKAV
jgi:hypothetical protein